MKTDVQFIECGGEVDLTLIRQFEDNNQRTLPSSYIKLIQSCDAGRIQNADLVFYDSSSKQHQQIGIDVLLAWNPQYKYSKFLEYYKNPPEFFPQGLVAFGLDGGGNLFCFDYRTDPNTDNPPIVFWHHEYDEPSFLAKDFDEFLSKLTSFDEAMAELEHLRATEKNS